ncbi:hypothetical protein LINPERHAP2_LOCUS40336 [Linum perenne]
MRLHLATIEGAMGRYVRVCVEVEFSNPLLGKYMVENQTFYVEYEGLEKICFSCDLYGHNIDGCSSSVQPQTEPVEEPRDTTADST